MAKTTLQLRRGSQAENAVFTGALGEVVVDTTRKTLVVHDGATVGGTALATLASPAFSGNPTAPTPTYGDNDTSIATTRFVQDAIAGFSAAPSNTDAITEGTTNLYFTKNRLFSSLTASGNITITQPGGAGTNAVINYTQPTNVSSFANDAGYLTNASILNSISVVSTPNTALTYDNVTGVFTFTQAVSSVNGVTGIVVLNTDNISDAGRTNKWASSTTVRSYMAAGTGLTYTGGTGTFALTNTSIQIGGKTFSLTSGTNQAYTTDDLTQGSTNLYASTTNVRAALSAGTGVGFTGGVISIGQAVGTGDTVSFANVTATTNLTVNTSLLKTDAGNSRVGVNTATPAYTLDVTGDVNVTGRVRLSGNPGTDGHVLQSKGSAASPQWVDIATSLPEIVELDKFRIQRNAQSTWFGFINGSIYTDPEDALGTQGYGQFTVGMSLSSISITTASLTGSGAVSFTGSISGTTLTVTTAPTGGIATLAIGMGLTTTAFEQGNNISVGTYILNQLTATSAPLAQQSYGSGGALGSNTFAISAPRAVIAAGQLVQGTGIPDGTTVVRVSDINITLSNNLTAQAAGTYSFYTYGGAGTYAINQSQTITSTSITGGVAWLSINANDNSDLDGKTPPFQVGQRIVISNAVPAAYNGTYTVTAATPNVLSYASTATGAQQSPAYVRADIAPNTTITAANKALVTATVNGTTLTINSINNGGTISIGQALYIAGSTVLANLYIVSGSGSSWTLNRNAGNLGTLTNLTLISYTVSQPQTCLPTLINGSSSIIDGGNSTFAPTTNGNSVEITYPIQVQIVKNGVTLGPWLNNSGSVWQNLTPFGDYTVDSFGNIVFSTPPQASDSLTGTVLIGRSVNPVVKTYPFRAVDIMLGT